MDLSNPPVPDPVPPVKSQEAGGMLGTLLTSPDIKVPTVHFPSVPPTVTTQIQTKAATPVIVTANTVLGQLHQGSAHVLKADVPHTSGGAHPLIIGLISSGTDTKSTVAVPLATEKTKSPKKTSFSEVPSGGVATKLVNPPSSSGGFGSGKPKAFLSMMSEGARTPPSASGGKKQTSSTKKGQSTGQSSKTSGTKAQTSKSKLSTPGGAPSSLTDSTPSARSHRVVKRPRNYDNDDMVDYEPPKGTVKKTKATPKGTKASKKTGQTSRSAGAVKDLGRWRPTDDLMLISAVQQTNDLAAVYLGIKFSCRFTQREIEERWYALLYNPQISHIAVEAMRGLHPGVVTMALNNALWSQEEEAVLAKIPSSDPGHLETFQSVLKENPAIFHTCRTATSLHHHWVLMGHYNLLNDQKVQLIPPGENVTDFTDAEDQTNDRELSKPRDVREEAIEQELMATDRLAKREIMKLEEDLPLWQTVLDTGTSPDFHKDELAVFRGKLVEFRMAQKSVIFGRATPTNKVDFDLSLEGPAYKISRRQASVHFTDNGEFLLHNEGRRPLFVDGKALLNGRSVQLTNSQTIEVASMSFLVLLNSDVNVPSISTHE